MHLVPLAFVVLALPFGSRQFHWDTLERAYLLEHPADFLRTWDGSPRSLFVSFAHVLELPMAALVRLLLGQPSGLTSLRIFEALAAGIALLCLGRLVYWACLRRGAAIAAQALLATTFGFWKMGSSGEERIVALATMLLFLLLFWQALANVRRSAWVAAALVLAILTHLTAAVLVPFAFLALVWLPPAWRAQRSRVARTLLAGTLTVALAYYSVAAFTADVRSPAEFIDYLTFFHRADGNNFLEITGSASATAPRLLRAGEGLATFFGTPAFPGWPVLGALFALCIGGAVRGLLRARATSTDDRAPRGGVPVRALVLHAFLLAALWTLHFTFYEPENIESWTWPATALVLVAALLLAHSRWIWSLPVLAGVLLAGNLGAFVDLHEPMALERYRRVVVRESAPGDIVVLVGGIQNGQPLRGSIAMRYFLAHERERTMISLYDVMQVTEREYWGRPFPDVATLQRAIETGRRVWFPAFLRNEFDHAQASGQIQLEYEAHGDSLYEITGVSRP